MTIDGRLFDGLNFCPITGTRKEIKQTPNPLPATRWQNDDKFERTGIRISLSPSQPHIRPFWHWLPAIGRCQRTFAIEHCYWNVERYRLRW